MTYFDLFVLRVKDMEAHAAFYVALGVKFEKHSHGAGPEHYAATYGGQVLELYPSEKDGLSLRFPVQDVDATFAALELLGAPVVKRPAHTAWGYRAVVLSPGGQEIFVADAASIQAPVPPRVVSVAAVANNALLLVKNGCAWTLPGGRKEPGETDGDCLKREFAEELPGSFVQPGSPFATWRAISPNTGTVYDHYVYFARVSGPLEHSDEITEARYVPNDELDEMVLSEATARAVESLRFSGRLQ